MKGSSQRLMKCCKAIIKQPNIVICTSKSFIKIIIFHNKDTSVHLSPWGNNLLFLCDIVCPHVPLSTGILVKIEVINTPC